MKFFIIIGLICASLGLAACGSDSATGGTQTSASAAESTGSSSKPKEAERHGPTVHVPPGPPPKKLIVRDLRKGTGPAIESLQDDIDVEYVGVIYETGFEMFETWRTPEPSHFTFWETHPAWERGLMGMRAGGRRELIEPSRLAYHNGAMVYVVDLLKVKHH